MKAHLTLTFALLLICTGAGAALAQTPDELPPALETVCDNETGAAYGLCNAYCEAMDCETDNASATADACGKVRAKFQNVTGRDLPCEVTCPCSELPIFASFLSGQMRVAECKIIGTDGIAVGSLPVAAFSFPQNGQWSCGQDLVFVGGPRLPVSPEQGQYCASLLEQTAASQGVTCR